MSMVEYNKIETVYRRDEKTKKLVIGEFNNPTLEFCKDLPWTFTEKVDGTSNLRWSHRQGTNARSAH